MSYSDCYGRGWESWGDFLRARVMEVSGILTETSIPSATEKVAEEYPRHADEIREAGRRVLATTVVVSWNIAGDSKACELTLSTPFGVEKRGFRSRVVAWKGAFGEESELRMATEFALGEVQFALLANCLENGYAKGLPLVGEKAYRPASPVAGLPPKTPWPAWRGFPSA